MIIYLYTGNGAGKTTNALGLALRAMGQDKTVLIIQFLKWNKDTGEYKFQWKGSSSWLSNHLEVHQFGREGWHGFDNITTEDHIKANEGLLFAHDLLNGFKGEKHFDLLVLDEINLAIYLKLISIEMFKLFLMSIPQDLNIVMTGRNATPELIELADVVNEIVEVKAPKTFICEKGIQY
jgi:cob(I)alamin adenosyltransferase